MALERAATLEGQLAATTQEVRCVNVWIHPDLVFMSDKVLSSWPHKSNYDTAIFL